MDRHKWTEKDERTLMGCVDWVDNSFEENNSTLVSLGGKWEVVAIKMKKESGYTLTDEACKGRFFKIKRREQHKVSDSGKKVVSLLGTDFPQADVKPTSKLPLRDQPLIINLQKRVAYLESELKHLKDHSNNISDLREKLNKFFNAFGMKVPNINV